MNRKTMYILVAALVIVIVVAGVGIYLFMGTGGGEGGGGGGGTQDTYIVANATSLQFEANVTSQGATVTYDWAGTNLNSTNVTLRIDLLGGEAGNYSYILNGGNQTAWTAVNGEWTDISSDFNAQWKSWSDLWTGHVDALKNWSGTGDCSYTATDGSSITIYNIAINPTLPDSLFQPI